MDRRWGWVGALGVACAGTTDEKGYPSCDVTVDAIVAENEPSSLGFSGLDVLDAVGSQVEVDVVAGDGLMTVSLSSFATIGASPLVEVVTYDSVDRRCPEGTWLRVRSFVHTEGTIAGHSVRDVRGVTLEAQSADVEQIIVGDEVDGWYSSEVDEGLVDDVRAVFPDRALFEEPASSWAWHVGPTTRPYATLGDGLRASGLHVTIELDGGATAGTTVLTYNGLPTPPAPHAE